MKKLLIVSAITASTLMAQGYRIPEQSLNSTALAGAYVSNTSAADAAYFNPANMAFMSSDKHLEMNMMYIHLNPVDFNGQLDLDGDGSLDTPQHTAQSASEDFIIPQMYLVAAPMGEDEDVRFGLSVNAPAGLSKRWPEGIQAVFAEEFSLKVIEINPTLSYRIMDNLAIAGGVRFLYSEGVIKAGGPVETGGLALEGSSWDVGYNLALSYRPMDMWGVALTYRSTVDLTMEGGAELPSYAAPMTHVSGGTSVPVPGVLTLATDVDVTESTNIEFVYERVFWSAYDQLDIEINYPDMFGGTVNIISDKNWEDANSFRLGLTQKFGDAVDLMVGLAYDQTGTPDETLGFELPDSDGYIGSVGVRYAVDDKLDVGAAVLYDKKEDRYVSLQDNGLIDGTFSGASAVLLSVGLGYKF
ncbi:MAG: outer membrane protein transport protein [Campylobacterota bacterium]